MMNSEVHVSGHYLAQHPVAAAVAEQLIRHVWSLIGPHQVTFVELVSSRSCVQLGSHLHAWTLLDILGLLLSF